MIITEVSTRSSLRRRGTQSRPPSLRNSASLRLTANSYLFSLFVAGIVSCCPGCDSSPAQVVPPTVQTPSSPKSSSPKIPNEPAPSKPTAVVEATFDDLKFEIEPDAAFDKSMLTPKVKELCEQRIRIRGYIYPTLKKRGIKQFVLVRDNLECCFGPGAALFDCILVHMEEGKTAEFSIRPVAVEGTFKFEEFLDYDGTTRAIFRINGESVE